MAWFRREDVAFLGHVKLLLMQLGIRYTPKLLPHTPDCSLMILGLAFWSERKNLAWIFRSHWIEGGLGNHEAKDHGPFLHTTITDFFPDNRVVKISSRVQTNAGPEVSLENQNFSRITSWDIRSVFMKITHSSLCPWCVSYVQFELEAPGEYY